MIGKDKIPPRLFSEETRACGGAVRLDQDYRGMDQTFHRWYDRLEAGFIMTMAACNLARLPKLLLASRRQGPSGNGWRHFCPAPAGRQ